MTQQIWLLSQQLVPQHVWLPEQLLPPLQGAAEQVALMQTGLAPSQWIPHPPQCRGSLLMLTHDGAQQVWPGPQGLGQIPPSPLPPEPLELLLPDPLELPLLEPDPLEPPLPEPAPLELLELPLPEPAPLPLPLDVPPPDPDAPPLLPEPPEPPLLEPPPPLDPALDSVEASPPLSVSVAPPHCTPDAKMDRTPRATRPWKKAHMTTSHILQRCKTGRSLSMWVTGDIHRV